MLCCKGVVFGGEDSTWFWFAPSRAELLFMFAGAPRFQSHYRRSDSYSRHLGKCSYVTSFRLGLHIPRNLALFSWVVNHHDCQSQSRFNTEGRHGDDIWVSWLPCEVATVPTLSMNRIVDYMISATLCLSIFFSLENSLTYLVRRRVHPWFGLRTVSNTFK